MKKSATKTTKLTPTFKPPQTLDHLVSQVEKQYGKPIHIEAIGDERWEALTGIWLDHNNFGRILVRATDPPLYRVHCILHELAHILLEHRGCQTLAREIGFLTNNNDPSHSFSSARARLMSSGQLNSAEEEAAAEEIAYALARTLIKPRNQMDESAFG